MLKPERKIVSKELLKKYTSIRVSPKTGRVIQRVGLAHGCFDVLTPGHISFLIGARAMCETLVCSVSSDAVVKKTKGESRPKFSAKDRMFHLASLEFVDWVVETEDEDASPMIQYLSPVILMKGSDSAESTSLAFVHERETAHALGGSVYYVVPDHLYHTSEIVALPEWDKFSVEI
jgi:D-beta-D-heptose 7-phosphate kinase / D-beta-D-heptose 1-phosphate adenosyltransferase